MQRHTKTNEPRVSIRKKRTQDALKLAEIAYDLYKKQKNNDTIAALQTNANQTSGNRG